MQLFLVPVMYDRIGRNKLKKLYTSLAVLWIRICNWICSDLYYLPGSRSVIQTEKTDLGNKKNNKKTI